MMKKFAILLCLILSLGTRSFLRTTLPLGEKPAPQRTVSSLRYVSHPVRAMPSGSEDVQRWTRTYGNSGDESAYSVIQTVDGSYVFAGTKDDATWLVKTDAHGKVQWTHTYNVSFPFKVIQTADGGYALAGRRGGIWVRDPADSFLVKTDAQGKEEWRRIYDWGDKDYADSVLQTSDGRFVLAGSTVSLESGRSWDGWLGKTDANGNLEWMQTYGGLRDDHVNAVIQTTDGGFALAGGTWSYGTSYDDVWLVKTDAQGEVEWNQTYGGASGDAASSVIQTADGGFALVGITRSFGEGKSDAWLVKTDARGESQWTRTYGGADIENAFSGIQTADGGFALAGYTESYGAGERDAWLVKTNIWGVGQWNRTYGGPHMDSIYSVIETTDGGFTLAGTTDSYGTGGWDALVVKTDAWGVAPELEIPLPRWVVLGVSGSLALIATVAVVLWRRKKRR